MQFFGQESIFFGNCPTLFVTTMTGHRKDNIFLLKPLHGCPQKNGFGPKNSIFGPQKGHFGQSGPRNGPPGGQTATYRKTKGIQSSLRIDRSCHPIESGPSEPKKGWFHRCSEKNAEFLVKNAVFWPQIHFFSYPSNFFCHHHDGTPKRQHFSVESFARVSTKNGFGPKTAFLDPKRATLGNRGHETARQAAKQPPTRKLKVSRVTSGYGGLMIPLSRDRPSRKNGGFIGVA